MQKITYIINTTENIILYTQHFKDALFRVYEATVDPEELVKSVIQSLKLFTSRLQSEKNNGTGYIMFLYKQVFRSINDSSYF